MIVAAAACVAGLASMSVPAFASEAHGARPVLSVGGEVTTPAAYTAAALAKLPQTTATVTVGSRHVTVTGVLLETLVTDAGAGLPGQPAEHEERAAAESPRRSAAPVIARSPSRWASSTRASATIRRCWR